ncbi:MAG: asparagine synthase (glutamine-hydrolyzing) [Patescibacteria group bacterium]|nr:asparagine synthase (glutamine-hydrolyzing) [Patescibacteria group bacterium]
MCGIAGFFGFEDDQLIKKISRWLIHRGPDGEGVYSDRQVTLINRRLAIIDIEGGNQPIYNEDKSLVVVYNGEIYNYQELKKDLEKRGHRFMTNCDTEIIVHGYEEWQEKCFDKLNGMFALALFSRRSNELILARDHFGIKPLYYTILEKKPTKVIFASEIKPIINSRLIIKEPNDRVIYRYLKFRVHDDNEETFFKNVYRLMPGYLMRMTPSKIEIKKYTSLEEELVNILFKISRLTKKEVNLFREKLYQAIKLRLIADVPVGTCLSGGLDSSTVVTVVNQLLKEKNKEARSVGKIQKTFSAVFPGEINDEERYIDSVVRNLRPKIKNSKVYPKPEDFFRDVTDFIRTQEEPTISSGPYAQYQVMREAAKHVKVLLDGQGADEMLAGYLPYYMVYLRQLIKTNTNLPKIFREIVGVRDVLFRYLNKKVLNFLKIREEIDVDKLLNPKFLKEHHREIFQPTGDSLKKRLIEDIFYNSLPALLRYEDKNSMRFSIEGRVPFLDVNLLRYLFSLPDEAIIRDGWNKYILRQATNGILPTMINQRRNKIGFTTPEYQWFLRMKNKIYSIFLSQSFTQRPYFNQKNVLEAFKKFIEGRVDDTMIFWRLINLELWLREFFDKKEPQQTCVYQLGQPNPGKNLCLKIDNDDYFRYPIKTELIKKGDCIEKKLTNKVIVAVRKLISPKKESFFVAISEKVVAIAQGRSYFVWEIKPSFWANLLYRFVKKTPYGIGLGSPWTMELTIKEKSLLLVIFAALIAGLARIFGIRGVFYRLLGKEIAAIDGPTEYSLYPSNVSAKLAPKKPEKVAARIHQRLLEKLPRKYQQSFLGVVIIDANDLGQQVLSKTVRTFTDKEIEKIFGDNPMGQADEQTPVVLVSFKKKFSDK